MEIGLRKIYFWVGQSRWSNADWTDGEINRAISNGFYICIGVWLNNKFIGLIETVCDVIPNFNTDPTEHVFTTHDKWRRSTYSHPQLLGNCLNGERNQDDSCE